MSRNTCETSDRAAAVLNSTFQDVVVALVVVVVVSSLPVKSFKMFKSFFDKGHSRKDMDQGPMLKNFCSRNLLILRNKLECLSLRCLFRLIKCL